VTETGNPTCRCGAHLKPSGDNWLSVDGPRPGDFWCPDGSLHKPVETTSPAGELRAAAKLMRELATAATPGPWERPLDTRYKNLVGAALPEGEQGRFTDGLVPDYMNSGYLGRYRGQRERVAVVSCNIWSDGSFARKRSGRDLEYIASMHPAVALALADWLDAIAEQAEQSGNWALHSLSPGPLKVARAYLGTGNPDVN
jgi:hypothetical protein